MKPNPSTLLFYVPWNRPGQGDGTEFTAQAEVYASVNNVPLRQVIAVPKSRGIAKKAATQRLLEPHQGAGYSAVAFVMHADRDWLQTGHQGPSGAAELARMIHGVASRAVTVLIYGCLAGTTGRNQVNGLKYVRGSFAHMVEQELERLGHTPRVYAHTAKGHATRSPWVVEISPAGIRWVVEPFGPAWSTWVTHMRSQLWAYYPWLSSADLEAELGADPAAAGVDVDLDADPEAEDVLEAMDADPEIAPPARTLEREEDRLQDPFTWRTRDTVAVAAAGVLVLLLVLLAMGLTRGGK